MALPRVCSVGRAFVSRGSVRVCNTAISSSRITNHSRTFASTSFLRDTTAQNVSSPTSKSPSSASAGQISQEQRKKNAASVKLLKVPKGVTPDELRNLFKGVGLDVVDIQMDMDKFRFLGDTYASVQLVDEQQAQKAIQVLNGNASLGGPIYLRPMRRDSAWESEKKPYDFKVNWDEDGLRSAVQPILDRRRVRISVQSPAWGQKSDKPAEVAKRSLDVLKRVFGEFGIEAIGKPAPQFGHITYHPKFYCHMDFTTKEGAEAAMQAIHDTEVDGKRVWAVPSGVDAAKAYQIGVVSRELLTELQENKLAPPNKRIDKKIVAKKIKKDPLKFDRERNAKAAEMAASS